MKIRMFFLLFATTMASSQASAADRYFARSLLKARAPAENPQTPTPSPAPTPSPPSAEWQAGEWSAWSSTCSPSAVRTRSVACYRQAQLAADEECQAAKPSAEEVGVSSAGCEGILQNQALSDPLNYWTVNGSWQWRLGDVQLDIGSSINQTGFVPTQAGIPYTLNINFEPLGGTAYRVSYTYTITMGSQVITQSVLSSRGPGSVNFVGNGEPLTVTIKIDGGRSMRLRDMYVN